MLRLRETLLLSLAIAYKNWLRGMSGPNQSPPALWIWLICPFGIIFGVLLGHPAWTAIHQGTPLNGYIVEVGKHHTTYSVSVRSLLDESSATIGGCFLLLFSTLVLRCVSHRWIGSTRLRARSCALRSKSFLWVILKASSGLRRQARQQR